MTTLPDPHASDTHQARYVFAGIEQTTPGIETRINVTFTPKLSFEMYAQPFFSSGDYAELKELRSPGTFQFNEYGVDLGTVTAGPNGFLTVDPDGEGPASSFRIRDLDFSHRSLLGNAVLRWEWRPGSTLFLVWQQSRSGRITPLDADPSGLRPGRFDLTHSVGELFSIRLDNIFLIKINYWFNP